MELTEVYFNAQKPEEARTGMQTLITQDVDAVVIYNMEIVGIGGFDFTGPSEWYRRI